MKLMGRYAVASVGMFAILTGCSGSTPPASGLLSEGAPGSVEFSAVRADSRTRPEVFISATTPGSVAYYSNGGARIGSLQFHPGPGKSIYGGLATDASRDLYVGVIKDADVFAAPYKSRKKTLTGPGQGFDALAVDQQTGLVAGGNYHCCQNANIVIWQKGASAPCKQLSNDNAFDIYGVAFDAEHNLYVTSADQIGTQHILQVSGGCNATGFVELSTSNQFTNAIGGIQINAANEPVVSDGGNNLYTYARPVNGSLGAPIATTTIADGYRHFAFNADGKSFWMVGLTSVAKYAYPSGGSPIAYISKTEGAENGMADVAIAPALVP